MSLEILQGIGKLRFNDPLSQDSIEVHYLIQISKEVREMRVGFPPVVQSKADVRTIQPVDETTDLKEGVHYLETTDHETVKLKNLGTTWTMLS
jgi:hypothetical protein